MLLKGLQTEYESDYNDVIIIMSYPLVQTIRLTHSLINKNTHTVTHITATHTHACTHTHSHTTHSHTPVLSYLAQFGVEQLQLTGLLLWLQLLLSSHLLTSSPHFIQLYSWWTQASVVQYTLYVAHQEMSVCMCTTSGLLSASYTYMPQLVFYYGVGDHSKHSWTTAPGIQQTVH